MSASLLARLFFWLWFGGAIFAGNSVWLRRLPPLAMPGIVVALTAILSLAYFCIRPVRAWVDAIDLRSLVLLHAVRFIGIYFLTLEQRGELPRAFVIPGSIGDIIVATMALPVAFAPLEDAARRRAVVIWNVAGFIGLLITLLATVRIDLSAPYELRLFTSLPLSLIPTFFTPLLLAIHVILFARTRLTHESPDDIRGRSAKSDG